MNAAQILKYASTEGVRMTVINGDRLRLDCDHRPPTQLVDEIVKHKSELIEQLVGEQSDVLAALLPPKLGWLAAVSSLLGCMPTCLLNDGFIDRNDLEEQHGADPRQVARLIKTDPRWSGRHD